MALNSPGVEVQVIDESFYAPAGAGTTPLIVVATKSNKSNPSATGIAPGTLASNVGKVWTITSQRDLSETFGVPYFETDANNNPVHGGERNEYGLQAAYTALGVTSRAYIVRADVDLAALAPSTTIPQGYATAGDQWVDTDGSKYGVSEWDSEKRLFISKNPTIIDDDNSTDAYDSVNGVPKSGFGQVGDYVMVVTKANTNTLFYKNSNFKWVVVGSDTESSFATNDANASTFVSNCWKTSWPVGSAVVSSTFPPANGNTITINGASVVLTADVSPVGVAKSINGVTRTFGVGAKVNGSKVELYADHASTGVSGGVVLTDVTTGTLYRLGFAPSGSTTTSASVALQPVSLTIDAHTKIPAWTAATPSGSVFVNTSVKNNGANLQVKTYSGATQQWLTVSPSIYSSIAAATTALDSRGGASIAVGSIMAVSNFRGGNGAVSGNPQQATFKLYRRENVGQTTVSFVPSSNVVTSATVTISETLAGSSVMGAAVTVTIPAGTIDGLVTAIANSGLTNITAKYVAATGVFTVSHKLGGDFKIKYTLPNTLFGLAGIDPTTTANLAPTEQYDQNGFVTGGSVRAYVASNWKSLSYTATALTPYVAPSTGAKWFDPTVDSVDVMIHNGTTWVGYRTYLPATDVNGPIIAASEPTKQSDGVSPLVTGDIWVDTSDTEKYGKNVYVYNADVTPKVWVLQDVADQETPSGWLFADARWSTGGAISTRMPIKTMLTSDYLDPDAPDPALYPRGMRLWNLRRSGNNVKRFEPNYIDINSNNGVNIRFNNESMSGYVTSRWVTTSANNGDGSGTFGRHAQRKVVVTALNAVIDTNQDMRDTDTLVFNLLACPGYPETIDNMVSLNGDRGLTAFVVGDTPFRLAANGTDLANWATNSKQALDNGDDGAVTYDEYMGMFYPSGFTTDNLGNNIVVPPSHMMLRTIITSDQKGYLWFAPAGIRRGGVDAKVTSVGYVKNGEFQAASLHTGLRDVLYQTCKINPIATLPGSGIVNYGNLTRAKTASALDRINVARLVCYMRRQLDIIARPFLFEPNDRTTRNEIKGAIESFLLELVGQRAINDMLVLCSEENNPPSRIDRNELQVDVLISPVKSTEFILVPLRIKNTGEISST